MKKATHSHKRTRPPEMRPDYSDLMRRQHGIRGKYAKLFPRDGVVVVLDPDVAQVFQTSCAVTDALRLLWRAAVPIPQNGAGKRP